LKVIFTGMLAALAGVALVGASFVLDAPTSTRAGTPPTSTPDPTVDPCDTFKPPLPATCVPTQPARRESTNTPQPSATPPSTEEPELTEPTNPPPASTATPGGGAGAGGVSPPDTGAGTGGTGVSFSWFAMLGATLAAAGVALVSYGARRRT
jgi:hypothetical protein